MSQAVIVTVSLSGDVGRERVQVIELARAIEEAVAASGAGDYDGWEFAQRSASIFVYGCSAERLFKIIDPVVRAVGSPLSGVIVQRLGEAGEGANEVVVGF